MRTTRTSSSAASAKTRRCAIYTRTAVSAVPPQHGNSHAAQREACVAYIQRRAGWAVVEQYCDDGCSGNTLDRPGLRRLLSDAEVGKFDLVVMYAFDRLSRSMLDIATLMARFSAVGTSLVSITPSVGSVTCDDDDRGSAENAK